MLNNVRERVFKFLKSSDDFPIIAALASGLYPLLYYYNANFTLVNSWNQFGFFVVWFLFMPCVVFYITNRIFGHIDGLKKLNKFIIPILNFSLFINLLVLSTYGFRLKIMLLASLIAIILGTLFYEQLKRVIVFQFLLSFLVFFQLIPDFYKHLTYSRQWMLQPDHIEDATFRKTPNIYVIQPDGYANFSELKGENYNFNNDDFEDFLTENNFKLYNNYRSNYNSTLSSNSSLFAMKHHYYNNTEMSSTELYNARWIIVGDNPVISILKKNNYKTFLMLERPYLLVNRPKLNYDYCNIDYSEISFLARGFEINKEITSELSSLIDENISSSNFFFIGLMLPSHVSIRKNQSKGKIKERENYLKDLGISNQSLKEIVNLIQERDKNSLIILVADHGGYVGLDYSQESKIKQTERNLIYSIFTSALAIKWPDHAPDYDIKLKTSVNLFRILISYLSENEDYLNYLQEDKSYIMIEKGAPFGVYEYIDEQDKIVFNKFTN